MIEVAVDQDQVLDQVPIEIELDVSSIGNMTTLPNIVQTCQRQKKGQIEKCSICLIGESISQ